MNCHYMHYNGIDMYTNETNKCGILIKSSSKSRARLRAIDIQIKYSTASGAIRLHLIIFQLR